MYTPEERKDRGSSRERLRLVERKKRDPEEKSKVSLQSKRIAYLKSASTPTVPLRQEFKTLSVPIMTLDVEINFFEAILFYPEH
jgi:hypothetical protein